MSHYVFVYGSLRRGFGNHRILDDSKYIGVAYTRPEWKMVDLGAYPGDLGAYPGVVPGKGRITGEIYEVDDDTFLRLDRLESHPSYYRREEIDVYSFAPDVPAPVKVWMYVFQSRDVRRFEEVESGDWSAHRNVPTYSTLP